MGCCGGKDIKEISIKSKHFPEFRKGLQPMPGKVVAITGCTSGTGRCCAQVCAELGAKVVLLNRDSDRAVDAFEQLKGVATASGAPAPVHVPCDLQSFSSVRQAAAKLNEELQDSGLDVLCNNAGIMGFGDIATKDGCDIQMQTNHTSHFLLTALCFPLLQKAAELRGGARIVNHSSAARKMDPPMDNKFDTKYVLKNGGQLGGDSHKMFKGANFQRYQQTKLANVIFTYALRDKLQAAGSPIIALVAHPGVAPTTLADTMFAAGGGNDVKTMPTGVRNMIFASMMQSVEDGSMGIIRCCCDPAAKSGNFFGPVGKRDGSARHDKKEYKGKADLLLEEKLADEESRTALWSASEEVTECKFAI